VDSKYGSVLGGFMGRMGWGYGRIIGVGGEFSSILDIRSVMAP
jgi:hypothetical protein